MSQAINLADMLREEGPGTGILIITALTYPYYFITYS
jgi:hypothetical protein